MSKFKEYLEAARRPGDFRAEGFPEYPKYTKEEDPSKWKKGDFVHMFPVALQVTDVKDGKVYIRWSDERLDEQDGTEFTFEKMKDMIERNKKHVKSINDWSKSGGGWD